MSRASVIASVNALIGRFDILLVRRSTHDPTLGWTDQSTNPERLPPHAADDLRPDHPRLRDLQRRYAALACAATDHSAWTPEHVGREIDLRYFRADNGYLWQRQMTHLNLRYLLTAYYAKSTDRIGALASMAEDGMFGAAVFDFGDGTLLSRDTLDSSIEINALDEAFGIARTPGMSVLDIGAGYGRLGHRLANAVPSLKHVFCTDAVPESTFLADYYLKYRGLGRKVRSIPLDELDEELDRNPVDIATNIHSFSECTLAAICWWLDLLAKHHVRYLFIAPNTDDTLLSTEHSGPRRDFEQEIVARGWKLRDKRPKFRESAHAAGRRLPRSLLHLRKRIEHSGRADCDSYVQLETVGWMGPRRRCPPTLWSKPHGVPLGFSQPSKYRAKAPQLLRWNSQQVGIDLCLRSPEPRPHCVWCPGEHPQPNDLRLEAKQCVAGREECAGIEATCSLGTAGRPFEEDNRAAAIERSPQAPQYVRLKALHIDLGQSDHWIPAFGKQRITRPHEQIPSSAFEVR